MAQIRKHPTRLAIGGKMKTENLAITRDALSQPHHRHLHRHEIAQTHRRKIGLRRVTTGEGGMPRRINWWEQPRGELRWAGPIELILVMHGLEFTDLEQGTQHIERVGVRSWIEAQNTAEIIDERCRLCLRLAQHTPCIQPWSKAH